MEEEVSRLAAAIRAAAPAAGAEAWARALAPHLRAWGLVAPRQIAALLGQAAVEAGPGLDRLAEDTRYTSAERLCAVFPSRFPDQATARRYLGDAVRIANRAYAGRLGNGDEASGDGWRFRGAGLLQMTGRATMAGFAGRLRAPAETVADWLRTPDGAAAGACWFWVQRGLRAPADAWEIDAVTRAVNGPAMLGRAQRRASAEAALAVLQKEA